MAESEKVCCVTKKPRKTREAKPGELREIRLYERLERLSSRPESRIDLQRMLGNLSKNGQTYAKHLITSGPSSIATAAKFCNLTQEELEAALAEFERGVDSIRF